MIVNPIALVALIAGIYLVYQADKQGKSQPKAVYTIAGIITMLWSMGMLFVPQTVNSAMLPLVFGLASVGTVHSKGGTQWAFAAIAIFVFLSFAL
jgi:tryptophan-rich sensory protein